MAFKVEDLLPRLPHEGPPLPRWIPLPGDNSTASAIDNEKGIAPPPVQRPASPAPT